MALKKEKQINANIKTGSFAKTEEQENTPLKHIEQFLTWLFFEAPESGTGRLMKTLKATLRTFISATQKFIRDDATVQASAISYSLVISLVPSLIVALLFVARFIDINEYFTLGKEFVRKNGIPLDLEPYFNIIQELLNNAAAIGFVGFLITLFSATSVLRNLEDALNHIWKVKRNRNFIQKISGFIMVMIFGPVLLTAGISMGQSLVKKVSPPDIKLISREADGNIYALGERATLLHLNENTWQKIEIKKNIDYQAQWEPVLFNEQNNSLLDRKHREEYAPQIREVSANLLNLSALCDMEVNGEEQWLITQNGILLHSLDKGKTWMLRQFMQEHISKIISPEFKRIMFFDKEHGLIIGKQGLILTTHDTGKSWRPAYLPQITNDLNDIVQQKNGNLIIAGDNGVLLFSQDYGESWQNQNTALAAVNAEKMNLFSLMAKDEHIWIAGDKGIVLKSNNGGQTWQRINTGLQEINFNAITFANIWQGILVGEKGVIRYSQDAGNSWKKFSAKSKSNLFSVLYQSEKKRYIIASQNSSIFFLNDNFKGKVGSSLKASLWRDFLSATGNLFLPFLVIWILFFLIYHMLPYTNVHVRAAAGGAVITSFLYVLFINLFKVYLSSFSKGTLAIYGTLAAIPFSLMLVYFSVLIILYGAEVAYRIQYPPNIKEVAISKIEASKTSVWGGILLVKEVFLNYHLGKEPMAEETLLPLCQYDKSFFEEIIVKAEEGGYVVRAEGKIFPVKAAQLIRLSSLFSLFDANDYRFPQNIKKDAIAKTMEKELKELLQKQKDRLEKITLQEILEKNSEVKPNEKLK